MRVLILLLSLLPATLLAGTTPPASTPLAALSFLAGHCWKGTFPGKPRTDEHCFEWVYGRVFLRDRHVVHADGNPDALGETIYYWDSAARQIFYFYFEDGGGYSRGTVKAVADGLSFPPASYVADGDRQVYRARWRRIGEDAYETTTDFRTKDGWVNAWKLKMEKQPDSGAQATWNRPARSPAAMRPASFAAQKVATGLVNRGASSRAAVDLPAPAGAESMITIPAHCKSPPVGSGSSGKYGTGA
jgi:hypothetical protein